MGDVLCRYRRRFVEGNKEKTVNSKVIFFIVKNE